MPVSGSNGRVLELCHSTEGGEDVLYPAVQSCEGLPRSNLSHTKPEINTGTCDTNKEALNCISRFNLRFKKTD